MSQLLPRPAPPDTVAAFEPLDTESLASRIADRIVDAVAAGTLAPGQRLVEAEIAAALGVSRMPLREALKLLEAQGIVSVTPRRGSFVVPFDERRIGQICEARLALERLALRRAVPAFRADPGLLAETERPRRKLLDLPPYSVLARLTGDAPALAAAAASLRAAGHDGGIGVSGGAGTDVLVRAPSAERLAEALAAALAAGRPAGRIRAEVDPLRV
jgi:DNA-binding transcriptional regulator YhcF (GntR family)